MIHAAVLIINLYMIAIIVRALCSWVTPGSYGGIIRRLEALTDPVLLPLRRALPPIAGGVDVSPLIALIAAQILKRFLMSFA